MYLFAGDCLHYDSETTDSFNSDNTAGERERGRERERVCVCVCVSESE